MVGDLGSISIVSILCWFYKNCLHNLYRPGKKLAPELKLRPESLTPVLKDPKLSFFSPYSSFMNIIRARSPPKVLLGLKAVSL
jgi:hypothetical protein